MQKIEFTNGTTINGASTFNAMQDNVEDVFNGETPMGSIVVEDVECKNKFNKNGNLPALAGVYGLALSNFINSSMLGKEVTISCNTVMFVMKFGDNESTGIILESQYSNGITFVVTQEILNVADVKYLSMITLDEQWITYKEQQLGYELQSELGTERTKYVEYKEFSNKYIYSTKEQIIGEWLGKPLYRRVFTGTINDTEKWRFITDSGDIDKKIDTRGFINQGNSGVIVGIGEALSSEDSNLNYATRVIVVSNNLRLDCDGTKFANSPYEISIDYTKTTD